MSEDNKIKVSIYTTCYNHGAYIEQTIKSIINQKTNFAFELIIHDDASTDDSASIISKYAKEYPDKIRAILQNENQYSKRVRLFNKFIRPLIKGEYVAQCEGDDYWTDGDKLQKMVDFLDSHPEYSACAHNTLCVNAKTGQERIMFSNDEKDIELQDIIYEGSSAYHFSSLVYRAEYVDRPDYCNIIYGVGDYPLAIHLFSMGKIHYFPEVMSVYRVYTSGSWSETSRNNKSYMESVYNGRIKMLEMAAGTALQKYKDLVREAIQYNCFMICWINEDYKTVLYKYMRFTKKYPFKTKCKIVLFAVFPVLKRLRGKREQ